MKILLCCGGGFSSSAIASRMQKILDEKNLPHTIDFLPFTYAISDEKNVKDYDVIICCPHLQMEVNRYVNNGDIYHKPLYLLPPKMYGNMNIEEIIVDCEDVIKMYNEGMSNPIHFPGEDRLLRIKRSVAYRNQ